MGEKISIDLEAVVSGLDQTGCVGILRAVTKRLESLTGTASKILQAQRLPLDDEAEDAEIEVEEDDLEEDALTHRRIHYMIRESGMRHYEFAEIMGVSAVTISSWGRMNGCLPSRENKAKLKAGLAKVKVFHGISVADALEPWHPEWRAL